MEFSCWYFILQPFSTDANIIIHPWHNPNLSCPQFCGQYSQNFGHTFSFNAFTLFSWLFTLYILTEGIKSIPFIIYNIISISIYDKHYLQCCRKKVPKSYARVKVITLKYFFGKSESTSTSKSNYTRITGIYGSTNYPADGVYIRVY